MLQTLMAQDVVKTSLLTTWSGVVSFAPKFIAAVIVFLVGWVLAVLLGKPGLHELLQRPVSAFLSASCTH